MPNPSRAASPRVRSLRALHARLSTLERQAERGLPMAQLLHAMQSIVDDVSLELAACYENPEESAETRVVVGALEEVRNLLRMRPARQDGGAFGARVSAALAALAQASACA